MPKHQTCNFGFYFYYRLNKQIPHLLIFITLHQIETMKKSPILLLFFISFLYPALSQARNTDTASSKPLPPLYKFYIGSSADAGIFSSAIIDKTPVFITGVGPQPAVRTYGTLRFSYILNFGFTFNYNVSRHFGIYTGIDVKNIGFIEKVSGTTIKRRTYNLGAPVGIKIGNMRAKRAYLFMGGGADLALNYKEKHFVIRNGKSPKFNEWFSERTPMIMPYAFAGFAFNRGITIKAQYYPNNFLNPGFITNAGATPYYGYDVQLFMVSVGMGVPAFKKNDFVKRQVSGLGKD